MKRGSKWAIAVIVVAGSAFVVRAALERAPAATAAREARFQSVVAAYTRDFQLGSTRQEVEGRLRLGRAEFERRSPMARGDSDSDLVKIGDEPPPWYCNAWPVYVAFEFHAAAPSGMPDSDLLKKIELFSFGDGCL
jgi:hypothetical protein